MPILLWLRVIELKFTLKSWVLPSVGKKKLGGGTHIVMKRYITYSHEEEAL